MHRRPHPLGLTRDRISGPAKSAWGQTLPIRAFWTMSGVPPVATKLRTSRIGSFGP